MLEALRTVRGKTPVKPLATLVCDHCRKPFILEGGALHGKPASEGVGKVDVSFVLGHCTFVQETNGTLRAYHGWLHSGCGLAGEEAISAARRAHKADPPRGWKQEALAAGLNHMDVYDLLFAFDPGLGVNRPQPRSN
jgi:hypothetical protein